MVSMDDRRPESDSMTFGQDFSVQEIVQEIDSRALKITRGW